MEKLLMLLNKAENHLDEAEENLMALKGTDSPENLLKRVERLQQRCEKVEEQIKEKKFIFLQALVTLACFAKPGTNEAYWIKRILVRKGTREQWMLDIRLGQDFEKTCDLLTELISSGLGRTLQELQDEEKKDMRIMKAYTKKILKLVDPFTTTKACTPS